MYLNLVDLVLIPQYMDIQVYVVQYVLYATYCLLMYAIHYSQSPFKSDNNTPASIYLI